jgi:hypothetical protein
VKRGTTKDTKEWDKDESADDAEVRRLKTTKLNLRSSASSADK